MYYSSGNYEAFAKPEKPEGIEKKQEDFAAEVAAQMNMGK